MTKEEVIEYIKTEPNFEEFETFGYPCIILRQPGGNLNGYVGIPKGHHLYGKSYNDKIYTNKEPIYRNNPIEMFIEAIDNKKEENEYRIASIMNVHGGVTYSDKNCPHIETNKKYKKEELWWFGFDTGHSGDMRPLDPEFDIESLIANKDNLPKEFQDMLEMIEKVKTVLGSTESISEIQSLERQNQVYRDFEYVKLETQILAQNLKYYE